MVSINPEKFINRIFIGLTTLLLLTIMVSEASPIRQDKNNTQVAVPKNNTQAPVPKNNTQVPVPKNNTQVPVPKNNTQVPVPNNNNTQTPAVPSVPATKEDIEQFNIWVKYASAAYCNVTDWNCGKACQGETAGTRLVKFFSNTKPRDNNGFVAINDKEKAIVVGYRGTADVDSFLSDSEFFQTPFDNPKFKDAKVHAGFLAVYNDTREEITGLLKDLVKKNPGYKVISTGHSLGGSLAVLQTLDLIDTPGLNPSNLFTYTFGEPRTGNKAFANLVQSTGFKFFRLVNKNDIIPHLPPQNFTYEQYGPEFWIDPQANIVECSEAEDQDCSNSQVPKLSIISHTNYLDTAFLLTCLAK